LHPFFFWLLAIYSQKFILKIIKIQGKSPDFFYTWFFKLCFFF
jgi:hypothetical protein